MTSTTQHTLDRLLNGELSAAELEQLHQQPEFAPYLSLIEESGSWKVEDGLSVDEAWSKLAGRLDDQAKVRSITPLYWLAAVAAAVALLVLFLLPPSTPEQSWQTASGEQMSIELEDGSSVILNAGSSLSLLHAGDTRRYQLRGSALFQVSKGAPFTVETEQGAVQVLGTRFEVLADADHYVVSCYEGTVAVSAQGIEPDTLHAGEGVRLSDLGWLALESVGSDASWISGTTQFRATPLSEVLSAYERQFGIVLEYDGEERLYTGGFPNEDANQALNLIIVPMNLEIVARDNQKIRLRNVLK
ncbi:MAG: FecR domain-containing protein [Bacteroidia bacterium]|nr:FecR domain-containing protein [Bacteroidia bacterium]